MTQEALALGRGERTFEHGATREGAEEREVRRVRLVDAREERVDHQAYSVVVIARR